MNSSSNGSSPLSSSWVLCKRSWVSQGTHGIYRGAVQHRNSSPEVTTWCSIRWLKSSDPLSLSILPARWNIMQKFMDFRHERQRVAESYCISCRNHGPSEILPHGSHHCCNFLVEQERDAIGRKPCHLPVPFNNLRAYSLSNKLRCCILIASILVADPIDMRPESILAGQLPDVCCHLVENFLRFCKSVPEQDIHDISKRPLIN